ncbi:MAG: hypothetical protein JSS43_19205, partial [Proteobacteria bacterium]|nr:hypothetical protein [Pseudomonadota bacterium]
PRRGRPPKPDGAISKAAVQRAYRERQKAAGKIVRTIDAATLTAIQAGLPATIPDFDPKTQVIIDRDFFQEMQEKLRNALLKLALREADVAQLHQRNHQLHAELTELRGHYAAVQKDKIVLQTQIAAAAPRRRGRSPRR